MHFRCDHTTQRTGARPHRPHRHTGGSAFGARFHGDEIDEIITHRHTHTQGFTREMRMEKLEELRDANGNSADFSRFVYSKHARYGFGAYWIPGYHMFWVKIFRPIERGRRFWFIFCISPPNFGRIAIELVAMALDSSFHPKKHEHFPLETLVFILDLFFLDFLGSHMLAGFD